MAGCVRRGRADGFGARLMGRLSAMAKILKLVLSRETRKREQRDESRACDRRWSRSAASTRLRRSIFIPRLYPDAAGGFLVRKSMERGGDWNHITEPRADDIAKDHSHFYAMWSPGQYAVPELWKLSASAWHSARP